MYETIAVGQASFGETGQPARRRRVSHSCREGVSSTAKERPPSDQRRVTKELKLPPGVVDPATTKLIRKIACRVAHRPGFSPADIEDLVQDLVFEVLRKKPLYDPAKGSEARFEALVVRHGVTSLIRNRDAQSRDPRREGPSLNDIAADEEGLAVPFGELLFDGEAREQRSVDPRIDFDQLLAQLPVSLQTTAEALGQDGNVAAAARRLGLSRRAVKRDLMILRRHCESLGFDAYIE